MADIAHAEGESFGLLQELEHILESDPLIDEIGFIHPTQLAALNGEVDVDSLSEPVSLNFFSKDHKLGISTQILFPLYEQAKKAFFDVVTRYKIQGGIFDSPNTRDELEVGVMKHSKALLLLSADLGTAWNSRRAIALEKDALSTYMDELRLSELILSYSAKSDQAWSHRRWVIKRIAGKVPNLQEILRKESELVEKIAERSKMNYRAWNHRCWLVSYMTAGEVLYELKKSKAWAGLHVADSSCFHYRRRLMMRILEAFCSRNASASNKSNEIYETWKEELAWNEILIKRYIGREALWLYRRFLSLHWLRHFTMEPDSVSCKSKHTANTSDDGPSIFLDNELHLFSSCSTIPDNDFDDFQAQAMHSATYILWLAKQLPRPQAIELREKLNIGDMKALLSKLCPQRSFLWDSLEG
ncbi:protein prenyltransferase alpha subunit repeat-containing protein 1 isoform X1 [Punica granatum]|uniref:Protein prenyltransferase alpha subunit repeat-containing protein 1 isoform X1 n=1 Tax=Punica granatum TaxID=22663 RepID=A0A6P8E1P7_PUNGR|nr:protein prenyltransferase alpha subunit repeat-containing protein 1 isoform X1 [Punica granatum]